MCLIWTEKIRKRPPNYWRIHEDLFWNEGREVIKQPLGHSTRRKRDSCPECEKLFEQTTTIATRVSVTCVLLKR